MHHINHECVQNSYSETLSTGNPLLRVIFVKIEIQYYDVGIKTFQHYEVNNMVFTGILLLEYISLQLQRKD